jgi:hypothetical protein
MRAAEEAEQAHPTGIRAKGIAGGDENAYETAAWRALGFRSGELPARISDQNAQISTRRDAIADELLELLDFWKPAFFRSGPNSVIVDANLEYTSGAGHQRKLANLAGEGR